MSGRYRRNPFSRTSDTCKCREGQRPVAHCQSLQVGWDQERLARSEVCLVGAGGLGSTIALTLVQAGVGALHIIDPDLVEPSNLNRQLFTVKQLGEKKAEALARNVASFGAQGTKVLAYPVYFAHFLRGLGARRMDLMVVGVDNDAARLQAARACLEVTPVVNVGLSTDGGGLEVLVQEVGGPCLGCWWGRKEPRAAPCGGVPVDKTLAGLAGELAARASLSLLMPGRPRSWTRLALFPDSGLVAASRFPRRDGCGVCGGELR